MTQQQRNTALVCALSEWIEQHLGRDIYLDELARYSGYSLWHMQKIFRETTGLSLGRYIRLRKLTGAARRLRHSDDGIIDIALCYGFASQSHFTYMFRKHFGVTPTRYRLLADLPFTPPPAPLHQQYATVQSA